MGGTGHGKTSLLEAIYLATTTRSFRTSRLHECVDSRQRTEGVQDRPATAPNSVSLVENVGGPASGFYTAVEVEAGMRSKLEFSWTSEGSQRRLNGERSSLEEHLGQQPVLAFSSADLEVLTGAPELRRRLIDRLAVAQKPRTLSVLARYRRTLEHKRALLQQRGGVSQRAEALASFDEILASAAEELIAARLFTIEALRSALLEVAGQFPRPDFSVDLRYRSSPQRPDDVSAVEDPSGWAFAQFAAKRGEELAAQRPLVGPHRDRIDVLFRGGPVAASASAGERKAIGLLLLAAQSRMLRAAQRAPILLVDDVDTEMDQATLQGVWPLLTEGSQSLFTSNRKAVFEALETDSYWHVERGRIEAAKT